MRHDVMRALLSLPFLLLLPFRSLAAPDSRVHIAIVDGAVTLPGGTKVTAGDRLTAPFELDATSGGVSLVWEETGVRLLAEGIVVRVLRADGRGVRLRIDDTRLDLPPGQGLHARSRADKTPKVFLRASEENTSALTIASCQTLVRLLPASSVSISLDREGMRVVVQGEGGVVEVIGRESMQQVLTGQRFMDGCVPPPGEASVEPGEARSPLTPTAP